MSIQIHIFIHNSHCIQNSYFSVNSHFYSKFIFSFKIHIFIQNSHCIQNSRFRYGPCDYVNSGLELKKNLNWAPELLDLLHRLIGMTRHDFNSCFCNLYRHGHDMCGWHSDIHPQLGRNPPVASVSLGAVRVFEFRKKNGPPNFIRFPLFPGSLLVMEGATQEDWLHCLPRDVNCKEERVNLTFRIMYAVDKRT